MGMHTWSKVVMVLALAIAGMVSGKILAFRSADEMFDADTWPVVACDSHSWLICEADSHSFLYNQLLERNSSRMAMQLLEESDFRDRMVMLMHQRMAILMHREIQRRTAYTWTAPECFVLPSEKQKPGLFPMSYDTTAPIDPGFVSLWMSRNQADADKFVADFQEPMAITITDGKDDCGIFGVQCDEPGCVRKPISILRDYPRCKTEEMGLRVACSYCLGVTYRPKIVIAA